MKQYSFNKVSLIINGREISGFTEGAGIITASRAQAQHTKVIDAKGKMVTVTSADKSGIVTFNLLQTSDDNSFLRSWASITHQIGLEDGEDQMTPLMAKIEDKMGKELVVGVNGFIVKQPDQVRGNGIVTLQWQLCFENIQFDTVGIYTEVASEGAGQLSGDSARA